MFAGAFAGVAALMFETLVTVWVGAWAHMMARGVSRHPMLWAVGTMVGSFAVHRVVTLLTAAVDIRDLAFSSGGALVASVLPIAGSALVFIATPLALPRIMPNRPLIPATKAPPKKR